MTKYLAKKLIDFCIKNNITINLAESCTGGLISSKIVSIANASKVFNYGIITYTNESKHYFLKVPLDIIKKHGAVSQETAKYMVKGLSKKKNIIFSFAVTGIAGPLGGTKEKPIGLVYFSFLHKNKNLIVDKKVFKGNRNEIRESAANYALKRSYEIISS